MSDVVSFFVPGRPFAKQRPRFGRGRAYTHPETAAAEKALRWYAERAADWAPLASGTPWQGPIELTHVTIYAVPPSWSARRAETSDWHVARPDQDNVLKLTKDALNGVLWIDDAQVCVVRALKRYARPGEEEGLHVRVRRIDWPSAETEGAWS